MKIGRDVGQDTSSYENWFQTSQQLHTSFFMPYWSCTSVSHTLLRSHTALLKTSEVQCTGFRQNSSQATHLCVFFFTKYAAIWHKPPLTEQVFLHHTQSGTSPPRPSQIHNEQLHLCMEVTMLWPWCMTVYVSQITDVQWEDGHWSRVVVYWGTLLITLSDQSTFDKISYGPYKMNVMHETHRTHTVHVIHVADLQYDLSTVISM